MGLDNGFYIVSNKQKITRDMLPDGIVYPFDKDYDGKVEIVYWRKNWGLRNAILRRFGTMPYDYIINIETPEDVMDLIEEIASWLDKEKWENDGNSIWDYDVIRPILVQNIVNLAIACAIMVEHPDVYLQFYDSY